MRCLLKVSNGSVFALLAISVIASMRPSNNFLALYPETKKPSKNHGLRLYPISRTPFIVLYDFDDVELRIHFVFHARADLRSLDPTTVVW